MNEDDDDWKAWNLPDEMDKIRRYTQMLVPPIIPLSTDDELKDKKNDELKQMLKERHQSSTGSKAVMKQKLMTLYVNEKEWRRNMHCALCRYVRNNINRYGNDAFGDKPKDLCRVEYWLAHVNDANALLMHDRGM
jgi:hypothetical protein